MVVALGVLRSAPLRASLSATTTHAPEAPLRPPPKFRPHPFAYHEEVTVTIDDLSSLGDGVGRVQLAPDASNADGDDRGWVVMVPFTLPGETVRARVFRNHAGSGKEHLARGEIGEFLAGAKPFMVEVREAYTDLYDFSGMSFVSQQFHYHPAC